MNEEIKKWRGIKKELSSRKIAFLELDSEDLCDYGNDTPHAITLNVDDDGEDLVFALRKEGKSYLIQYGEDLLESDEDRDISAKEMVDFVEREIEKANESSNGAAVGNHKYKVHATDIEYDLDEEDGDPDLPKELTLLVESDANKDDPYFSDVVCNAIEDEVGWMVKNFRCEVLSSR